MRALKLLPQTSISAPAGCSTRRAKMRRRGVMFLPVEISVASSSTATTFATMGKKNFRVRTAPILYNSRPANGICIGKEPTRRRRRPRRRPVSRFLQGLSCCP